VVPALRRAGRLGAVVLHGSLVGILGPLGLGHSLIVLVWNAAIAAEVWVALGPETPNSVEQPNAKPIAAFARLIFWGAAVLPLGERIGVFDAWPSHALYASHVGRVSVFLHESELGAYPLEVRRHLRPDGAGDGPWHRIDLTGWSRAVRGTPVYPQNRACLGLAEALAARYGVRTLVRVVVYEPADRWTGRRRSQAAIGREAIRRLGDRYFINAHPASGLDP
jgi:hypothetical protein